MRENKNYAISIWGQSTIILSYVAV
jgi:hypothetical protein